MRNSMHGKDGDDIIIDLPIGSVVTDKRINRVINLTTDDQKVKILNGGRGGLGNEHFKASTNVTPTESTPGKDGEEAEFYIELELVADGGLIGLPNAGKSSLLNALTNAQAKVGSYQFTTLEPNLGALAGGFILADIPGLIEGASEGKGLGHKFLRHVKRTRMIFHIISLENEDVVSVYKTIRAELKQYDIARGENLSGKPETIILTKTDIFGTDVKVITKAVTEAKRALSKATKIPQKDMFSVTILDDVSVKVLADEIVKLLRA
jgi:GTP-binding protein